MFVRIGMLAWVDGRVPSYVRRALTGIVVSAELAPQTLYREALIGNYSRSVYSVNSSRLEEVTEALDRRGEKHAAAWFRNNRHLFNEHLMLLSEEEVHEVSPQVKLTVENFG